MKINLIIFIFKMFIAFKFHAFPRATKFDNKKWNPNFIHEIIMLHSSTIHIYIHISMAFFAEQLMHNMHKVMQNFLSQEHLEDVV